jgi:hypothetical protein
MKRGLGSQKVALKRHEKLIYLCRTGSSWNGQLAGLCPGIELHADDEDLERVFDIARLL